MKKSFKKWMAAGLVAVTAVSLLVGCGGKEDGGKSKDGKTKITMALWDEEQNKVMKEMIKAYEAENPDVTVETQLTTWSEYWTKLEASVTGGDAADIFWVNVLKAEGYADAGILMDISDIAEELNVEENFPEKMAKGYVFDDKTYAIPKDFDTAALFYNKELFDKAGVPYPTEEWTVDDMVAAAEKLKPAMGEGEYPTAAAFNSGSTTYEATIYANGGYIINEDNTKMGWDDPKSQEGLQAWYQLLEKGLSPTSAQMADTLPDTMFENGKLGMLMVGNYMISTFEQNDAIKGKYDMVQMPGYNGKKTTVINGLGYAINANTKQEEAAKKFVTWLGGEEAMKLQGQGGVVISARNDAQHYFAEKYPELNCAAFVANLDDTVLLEPRTTAYTELMTVQKEVMAQIWDGTLSIAEGTKKITEDSQPILDKMNGK